MLRLLIAATLATASSLPATASPSAAARCCWSKVHHSPIAHSLHVLSPKHVHSVVSFWLAIAARATVA
eukprot:6871978-Prymnesium_polylepis.1